MTYWLTRLAAHCLMVLAVEEEQELRRKLRSTRWCGGGARRSAAGGEPGRRTVWGELVVRVPKKRPRDWSEAIISLLACAHEGSVVPATL